MRFLPGPSPARGGSQQFAFAGVNLAIAEYELNEDEQAGGDLEGRSLQNPPKPVFVYARKGKKKLLGDEYLWFFRFFRVLG